MDEKKGIRVWQWAVLLLVLCNLGLIATIWLRPRHDAPPPRHAGPRDFVIQKLRLTDEQVKKYDVLIQAHQQAMQRLRHDNSELRSQLFAHLKDQAQDNLADSLATLIAANQKEIETVTYNHFAQVRALCNDEQKKDFDNIIGDVIRQMNGGAGGPHPPGRPQGPPPPGEGPDGPPHDGPPPGDH